MTPGGRELPSVIVHCTKTSLLIPSILGLFKEEDDEVGLELVSVYVGIGRLLFVAVVMDF